MKNQTEITIAVSMITYNHEEHIAKAIEGVMAQQTNFRFKLFITEDKSPDKTATVCREYESKYPNLIDLEVFTENIGANPNWVYNLKKCFDSGAKYIATCEGDDYWIDPLKLQKQVDFLEANPDYGMVHTDLHEHNISKNIWRKNIWSDMNFFQEGDIFNSLLIGRTSMIYLCTVTFRKDMITDFLDDFLKLKLVMGDSFLYLVIAAQSKIGYFSEAMAVRQLLSVSATQGGGCKKRKAFLDSGRKLLNYIYIKFNIDQEIKRIANESISLRYLELFFNCDENKLLRREAIVLQSHYFIFEKYLYKLKTGNRYLKYLIRQILILLKKSRLDYTSRVYKKLTIIN